MSCEKCAANEKAFTKLSQDIIQSTNDKIKDLETKVDKAQGEFSRGFFHGWQRAFNYWSTVLFNQVFSEEGLKGGVTDNGRQKRKDKESGTTI